MGFMIKIILLLLLGAPCLIRSTGTVALPVSITTQSGENQGSLTARSNHTYRYSSHVQKRFVDYPKPCTEVSSILDPRDYFQTTDVFFPKLIQGVACEGSQSSPLPCGGSDSYMQCITRLGSVELMRMPSYFRCWPRTRVIIPDVPIGCYCM